jgi:hypothetical protein
MFRGVYRMPRRRTSWRDVPSNLSLPADQRAQDSDRRGSHDGAQSGDTTNRLRGRVSDHLALLRPVAARSCVAYSGRCEGDVLRHLDTASIAGLGVSSQVLSRAAWSVIVGTVT